MTTNDEIKEKIYEDTLNELAKTLLSYKDDNIPAITDIETAVKLAIDKTEPAARAEGYKEGQRDAANKIFKELDKQVEIGRLRIGKNAIATCGIIKVYRGSAYVESRKKWLG